MRKYRCLAVGRSHAIVAQQANALALMAHAAATLEEALPGLTGTSDAAALNLDISAESATFLQSVLQGEVQRHRALVYIDRLREDERQRTLPQAAFQPFLVDRLSDYPEGGVDLARIVELPPSLSYIPAKPIFLDVAWNHIGYPRPDGSVATTLAAEPTPATEQQQQKKGWFGFRR